MIDASPIMEVVVEEALRRAKKVFVLWKKNSRSGHNSGAISSETLGEYSYSLNTALMDKVLAGGSLSSESRERLQPFVNYGLMV